MIEKSTPLKTVRDVDFFDTVWIVDKSEICYEGWIYEKTKKHIIVTVYFGQDAIKDFMFIINREDLSKSCLEENHVKVYFDKRCLSDK